MSGEIFPSFPNFNQNMWNGNEPNCKGHDMVGGGQSQKWTFRYGNAETFEDRILCASFSLSPKVTISIVRQEQRNCTTKVKFEMRMSLRNGDLASKTEEWEENE